MTKEQSKAILESHIKDRLQSSISQYNRAGEKVGGTTEGHIAERDGTHYMLKASVMNPSTIKQEWEKYDVLREYMAPFERFLYDRAPVIGLTQDKSPEKLHIRSKMIEGFTPLSRYTGYKFKISSDIKREIPEEGTILIGISDFDLVWKKPGDTKPQEIEFSDDIKEGIPQNIYNTLIECISEGKPLVFAITNPLNQHAVQLFGYQKPEETIGIQGFEKVIAASLFFGDLDFNPGNIGIISRDGEKQAVKIDHGRAFSFYTSEQRLREELAKSLNIFCYQNIDLDARKLKSSIDEITKISDEEIENLVKRRVYHLKKSGFTLDDSLFYREDGRKLYLAPATPDEKSRWINLENNYIALYKRQREIFKDFSHTLEQVQNLDKPEKWKKREWIYEIKGDDPILWRKDQVMEEERVESTIGKIEDAFDRNDIDLIKRLIDQTPDLNKRERTSDGLEKTILYLAVEKEIPEIVKLLLDKGADPNVTDNENITPLHRAAYLGNLELTDLLISKGALVNAVSTDKITPLHVSIYQGDAKIVESLLKHEADPAIPSEDGKTALHIAIENEKNEIASLLMKNKELLNLSDQQGETPLAYASTYRNDELATALIEAGADTSIRPKSKSPEEWAQFCATFAFKSIAHGTHIKQLSPTTVTATPSLTRHVSHSRSSDF